MFCACFVWNTFLLENESGALGVDSVSGAEVLPVLVISAALRALRAQGDCLSEIQPASFR